MVEGSSGHLVVCAIYEISGAGFELRVGYTDRTFRAERLADCESARARAAQWLTVFRAAGVVGAIDES